VRNSCNGVSNLWCSILPDQHPKFYQFLIRYTVIDMESVSEHRLKNRVKWLTRYGLERFHLNVLAIKYSPSLLAVGVLFAAGG